MSQQICHRCGLACRSTLNMCPNCHAAERIPDAELHVYAQRMAKYGHRPWILWTTDEGHRHALRATWQALETAIRDVNGRKFTGYSGDGTGNILNPEIANAWLSNAKAGMLS